MTELAKRELGLGGLKSKIVELIDRFYPNYIDCHVAGSEWEKEVEMQKSHMTVGDNGDFYFETRLFLNEEGTVVDVPEKAVAMAFQVGHVHDNGMQESDLSVIYLKFRDIPEAELLKKAAYELRDESWEKHTIPTKLEY